MEYGLFAKEGGGRSEPIRYKVKMVAQVVGKVKITTDGPTCGKCEAEWLEEGTNFCPMCGCKFEWPKAT